MRKILAGVLLLIATAVLAQGASTPREIADLRLLPPTFRAPPALDLRTQLPTLTKLAVSIQRHSVGQLRSEDLRRAPMEDEQFAEGMAARIANIFSMDAARLGVVGFTHVVDTAAHAPRQPGQAVIPRRVLVQYAWPRKPGETGPSALMAATTQQSVRTFDEQTALRLAEHYFPEAFTGTAADAGTPTIALSPQGQVIAAGRVQYGSGANHEKLISEQLVPGIRSGAFVSPQLTNAAGRSVVVSFVWGQVAGSAR